MTPLPRPPVRQSGAALVVSLIMSMLLTLIGMSHFAMALHAHRTVRLELARWMAMQAAELALADAELAIRSTPGDPTTTTRGVTFGSVTGKTMPTGTGTLPAQLPRYRIDALATPEQPATSPLIRVFRITALGYGPDNEGQVALQIVVRHMVSEGEPRQSTWQRLSWRELSTLPNLTDPR